jgi:hypothetical protein
LWWLRQNSQPQHQTNETPKIKLLKNPIDKSYRRLIATNKPPKIQTKPAAPKTPFTTTKHVRAKIF